MKIKVAKGLFVDSSTLFRFEWRKWYPTFVVHEKFEKVIKWILRVIALIGIASSLISIDQWYINLIIAIIIFLIEQFFEKTVIEYTSMIVQPLPPFEVQTNQWKSNGFLIPIEKNGDDFAYFGPAYQDESYAIKFFKYLRTWIDDNSNDDVENTLVISLVIEPNDEYTTYIYANSERKRLDYMFKFLEKEYELEKYGKKQQKLFAQLFYWHTLDYKDGYFITQFLDFMAEPKPFQFTPSVIQPFGLPPKFLTDYSIKKYDLKIKKRDEVLKNEIEYIFDPAKFKFDDEDDTEENLVDLKHDILDEIQHAFAKAVDVGFVPNYETSAGVINLCFDDCQIPFAAYKQLIKEADNKPVILEIDKNVNSISLSIELSSVNRKIQLFKLRYDSLEFDEFIQVNGGGDQIVLFVGYPPANKRQIILEKDMSPLIVTWKPK